MSSLSNFFNHRLNMGDYRRYDLSKQDFILGAIVFIFSLGFYGYYLTPSVASGDNGELTSAMFYLGLGHAPGYPIHSLFGKLMTFLPFGKISWKANFFSAFSGSLTVYLSFLVYVKLLMSLGNIRVYSYFAAIIGAGVFMTSNTLWGQSITTEVYAVSAIFHPLLLLILLKWKDEVISNSESKNLYLGERYLLTFGFILGISTGGHQTVILIEFFVVAFLLFFVYNYQMKNRKPLEEHLKDGFFSFLVVVFLVLLAWFLYYKYIVSYGSNLFVNNNMNTKSGVWGFVIPNLMILGYYLFVKLFIPNLRQKNKLFLRLSFFLVKFMGVFYLGVCVYLYHIIRSHGDPPINWGGISESVTVWEKIAKFFTMINRKQFAPSTTPQTLYTIFVQFKLVLVKLHLEQFARPMFIIMALGMVELFRRCRIFLYFLVFGFVSFIIQLTFYLNADFRVRDLFFIEVFYIYSYFILSCFVPFGFIFIMKGIEGAFEKLNRYNQKLSLENKSNVESEQG